jgi:hypothetical protein
LDRRRLRDDLGEVVVDASQVLILGGDHPQRGAGATADVDEHVDGFEAAVDLEQLLDYDLRTFSVNKQYFSLTTN